MATFKGVEKWMGEAETEVFFALLRRALWGTGNLPQRPFSWECVIYAFEQHAVLGVVADAIMSLPQAERPGMAIQMKVMRYVGTLAQLHHKFDKVACMISDTLTSQGLHPVMLKGQGLATLYPKQHTRSCGDIDVYLHPEEFEQGTRLIYDLCGDERKVEITEPEIMHHVSCNYDEVHIEIHYRPGTTIYDSNRKEYEQWLAEEFRTTDSVLINGREIAVPHHHVNVIYVFCHLLRHFIGSGIGVRQFIDLMLLIQSKPIDRKALERDLLRFHLLEPWQIIGGVLVYQLGMREEDFPLWNAKRAAYLQGENLRFILMGGNLGQLKRSGDIYEKHDKHSLLGILGAIVYRWKEWKFYNLDFLYHLAPYENKHRALKSLMFLANIAIKRVATLKR